MLYPNVSLVSAYNAYRGLREHESIEAYVEGLAVSGR